MKVSKKALPERTTSFRNPLRRKSYKVNDAGVLTITILQGHDFHTLDNGIGKSRGVYCMIYLLGKGDSPKEDKKTHKVDPLDPQFNQDFTFNKVEETDKVVVILRNKGIVGKSKMIGQCEIDLSKIEPNQILTQWFSVDLPNSKKKHNQAEILIKIFFAIADATPRAVSISTRSEDQRGSRTVTFASGSAPNRVGLRSSLQPSSLTYVSKMESSIPNSTGLSSGSLGSKASLTNFSVGSASLANLQSSTPLLGYDDDSDSESSSSSSVSSVGSSSSTSGFGLREEDEDEDDGEGMVEIVGIKRLLSIPSNNVCCECGRMDPEWASITLGVFLCLQCSSIHRGLGAHISQIRSIYLDTWSPEQISSMKGNSSSKAYWEAQIPPGVRPPSPSDPAILKDEWIKSKYIEMKYLTKFDREREIQKEKERNRQEKMNREDSEANLIDSDSDNERERELRVGSSDGSIGSNSSGGGRRRSSSDSHRVVLTKKKSWWQNLCPCCF